LIAKNCHKVGNAARAKLPRDMKDGKDGGGSWRSLRGLGLEKKKRVCGQVGDLLQVVLLCCCKLSSCFAASLLAVLLQVVEQSSFKFSCSLDQQTLLNFNPT
jgi:hypothetical protein